MEIFVKRKDNLKINRRKFHSVEEGQISTFSMTKVTHLGLNGVINFISKEE